MLGTSRYESGSTQRTPGNSIKEGKQIVATVSQAQGKIHNRDKQISDYNLIEKETQRKYFHKINLH